MKKINIKIGNINLVAELKETEIGNEVYNNLPIEASINRWGDEIYFSVPIIAKLSNPQSVVDKGDLAYWEEGNCLCIFFGPTPISSGEKIIPASPVEVIGKVYGNIDELKKIQRGKIILSKKDNG